MFSQEKPVGMLVTNKYWSHIFSSSADDSCVKCSICSKPTLFKIIVHSFPNRMFYSFA